MMSATTPSSPPADKRAQRGTHMGKAFALLTSEARKRSAVVLEVLAGIRTPLQAAQALGTALPGYYQLELRALRGLTQACEPRPRGRQKSDAHELEDLRRQCQRLTADVQRYQALARATQRSVGVSPPPVTRKTGRRQHKPMVRALRAIAAIQQAPTDAAATPAAATA